MTKILLLTKLYYSTEFASNVTVLLFSGYGIVTWCTIKMLIVGTMRKRTAVLYVIVKDRLCIMFHIVSLSGTGQLDKDKFKKFYYRMTGCQIGCFCYGTIAHERLQLVYVIVICVNNCYFMTAHLSKSCIHGTSKPDLSHAIMKYDKVVTITVHMIITIHI